MKAFYNSLASSAVIAYFLLIIAAVGGYIMNIIDLIHVLGGPINAMFVARVVGIFAFPLGALLGYF